MMEQPENFLEYKHYSMEEGDEVEEMKSGIQLKKIGKNRGLIK